MLPEDGGIHAMNGEVPKDVDLDLRSDGPYDMYASKDEQKRVGL